MADLQIRNLRKEYGSVRIIPDLSLDVADGEFVVLVGPSGCGKSTLLRMIAGLEDITGGDLVVGGTRANDIPPQKRNMAMVFQSYALFPHMTVRDNISFGPRIRGEARETIEAGVTRASEILNLSAYLDRNPGQLSGGQRQRVAMGRSIVRDPQLFLFDEPLSNLDAKLRISMRTEIKALHQKLGSTIIYVTHDQIEAMTMADRIVVMNAGRIEQVGTPLDLYDHPANRFVAGFLGSPAMSFLPAVTVAGGVMIDGDGTIPTGQVAVPEGARVSLGIRPESFERDAAGPVSFLVSVIEPTGPETHVFGTIGGHEVRAVFRERLDARPGDRLTLKVAPDRLHLFDAATGARLG
ncbi:MAG: sn-glycerol-3-phosphate ABC transporter ATP-binding protein UgpC [Rubellimicrobium sp.]|nr:sn-glycerol-3-phosphate ABC transporter ATP-binding protein UgpC [Rubellimicrobium sp.]